MPLSSQNSSDFPPTRWSLVVRAVGHAADSSCDKAVSALDELLRLYWPPLYAYARRSGLSPEDAADAVQGFCESLIKRESLSMAQPEFGRLRSFLLGGFQKHLRVVWRDQHRQKRGGHHTFVLVGEAAQAALESVMDPTASPDAAFDRLWVRTLLDAVLKQLGEEYASRGRSEVFTALVPALSWGEKSTPYAEVAVSLGLTEPAVQQAVKRLRQRYRAVLEEQIAQTVACAEDAEAERLHLIQILAG